MRGERTVQNKTRHGFKALNSVKNPWLIHLSKIGHVCPLSALYPIPKEHLTKLLIFSIIDLRSNLKFEKK